MIEQMVKQEINNALEDLFGDMPAKTIGRVKVEHVLTVAAQKIEQHIKHNLLMNLKTADEVAEVYNITPRRIREKAKRMSERGFPVGWQVPGTGQWLFLPEEVEALRPDERFRPKKYR